MASLPADSSARTSLARLEREAEPSRTTSGMATVGGMVQLFDEADRTAWRSNAVVGVIPENDAILAHGYKHAVDVLIADWEEGHRFDLVVPTLVLLGRHSIELALKHAIRVAEGKVAARGLGSTMSTEAREEWLRRTASHKLVVLRDELSRLLAELGAETLPADVNDVIEQLADVDPAGDNFRYSTTWDRQSKSTVPTIRPAGPEGRVNISALGRWLSETSNYLLVIEDALDDQYP